MQLVQILLPAFDNEGRRFPAEAYRSVNASLTEKFGGVTLYARAPAEGVWKDEDGSARRDDIVVVEVMVDTVDRAWWRGFAVHLAERFRQQELVVRALAIELL
jgi:hypothetical protein